MLEAYRAGVNFFIRKTFRKAAAPWVYRHALARIEQLAQTNRVRFVQYCPSYTSQICPMCGKCSAENRKGETFCCIRCGYTADADYVGATNGLARTLQILGGLSSASGFPAPQRVGVEPTHAGVTGGHGEPREDHRGACD